MKLVKHNEEVLLSYKYELHVLFLHCSSDHENGRFIYFLEKRLDQTN